MALVEDVLTGNVAKVVAMGAAVLLLPRVVPALPAPLRGVVKSGVKLFVESESDAEGGIIGRLADTTLQQVLDSLNGDGAADQRQQRAEAAVQHFRDAAHRRARRYGRDESDRGRRYQRHMDRLRQEINRAGHGRTDAQGDALRRLSAAMG